jgi:16S rRNA (uracil1498-N3)-methyltransferase
MGVVMRGWPPRDRVLVFVDDLRTPVLDPDDRRHLEKSLRLRPGTDIAAGDGRGSWRLARLGPDLEPVGEIVTVDRPAPELVVGVAPVKGDRVELIVQKLTELGIDRVVALETERSVVRWDESRRAKNADRLGRIAREAAMQSRNPWLPTVESQQDLDRFVATWPGAVLADPGADHLLSSVDRPPQAVAIGPEGGFSPAELNGRAAVRLPGNVLRTETAALTAGVLLATLRGGRPASV